MLQEKIEAPDVRLVRLLAARMLEDEGIRIDAEAISALAVYDGMAAPQLQFTWPTRKLRIAIASRGVDARDLTAQDVIDVARSQADAYRRVAQDCHHLEALITETRTIAKREVAKLRRSDLAVELIEVRPSTIEADGDWLPSPEVIVEILDAALRPERVSIVVEDPAEIVGELSDARILESQMVRSARKRAMHEAGASCAVDAVIVAALEAGGIDIANVVGRMLDAPRGTQVDASGRAITITCQDGLIGGAFRIDEFASYKGNCVTSDVLPDKATVGKLKSLSADVVVEDPLFANTVVVAATESSGKLQMTIAPRFLLVDAATGRLTDRALVM